MKPKNKGPERLEVIGRASPWTKCVSRVDIEGLFNSHVENALSESINFKHPRNNANHVLETTKIKFFAEVNDTVVPNCLATRFLLVDQGARTREGKGRERGEGERKKGVRG